MENTVITYTVEYGLEIDNAPYLSGNNYDPDLFDLHYDEMIKMLHFKKDDTLHKLNLSGQNAAIIPLLKNLLKNVGMWIQIHSLCNSTHNNAVLAKVRINSLKTLFKEEFEFHPDNFFLRQFYPPAYTWNPKKSFCLITNT